MSRMHFVRTVHVTVRSRTMANRYMYVLTLSLLLGAATPAAAAEGGGGTQQCASLQARLNSVNGACCGRAGGKCKGGRPSACGLGCARALLKMHAECKAQLGRNSVLQAALAPVLALCKAALLSPPPPAAVPQNVSWPKAYTLAAATLKEDGDHYNAVGEYKKTKAM